MVAVIDASVFVKLFLPEPGADLAESVAEENRLLLAPDIVRIEVASAITRAARNGVIDKASAMNLLGAWQRMLELDNVRLLESSQLLVAASELSLELRHPLADCLYLQLAITSRVPLVTADKALAEAGATAHSKIQHLSSLAA